MSLTKEFLKKEIKSNKEIIEYCQKRIIKYDKMLKETKEAHKTK